MRELVFLVEEASAKAMLDSLLPRLLPKTISHRCIAFDGKQDLERQLARRLRGYLNSEARFIVLRDQDSAPDCTVVKAGLQQRVRNSGKAPQTLVRIACRELESFYLADLAAVGEALGLPKVAREQNGTKFRAPDYLGSPSKELARLTKNAYQKVAGSREIGRLLDLDNTRSPSFKHLVLGIRRLAKELDSLPVGGDGERC